MVRNTAEEEKERQGGGDPDKGKAVSHDPCRKLSCLTPAQGKGPVHGKGSGKIGGPEEDPEEGYCQEGAGSHKDPGCPGGLFLSPDSMDGPDSVLQK